MIAKVKKNKREIFQNIFSIIFFGALTSGFIAFFIISDFRITQRRKAMLGQISSLQEEIQAVQEKNAKLAEGISQIGDAHWEEKAREQGYKKPGEEQVVVLPPQESSSTSAKEQKNFWEKLLNKVGF
ncbi:MAG: septum formation initiator family protein [bacterium]|nr:septum formation initiator family protein [bacterium]